MTSTENMPAYTTEILDLLADFRIGWETVPQTNARVLKDYAKLAADTADDDSAEGAPAGALSPYGDLRNVFLAGLIKPGDRLTHTKARTGVTHVGIITTTGTIMVNGQEYNGASNSLKAAVGSAINGWGNWRHERSGRMLQDLRGQAGA